MIHNICQFQLPMIRGVPPLKPSIWLIVELSVPPSLTVNIYYKTLMAQNLQTALNRYSFDVPEFDAVPNKDSFDVPEFNTDTSQIPK